MAFCLDRGGENEEKLALSNCVYSSNTIISPCESLSDSTQKESGLGVRPVALLRCHFCGLVFLLLWTVSPLILRHFTKSHKAFNSCGVVSLSLLL